MAKRITRVLKRRLTNLYYWGKIFMLEKHGRMMT